MSEGGIHSSWVNDIHQGDAAETLAQMPESSVHCVVTSPPYFGLRDYGVDGQIGLEDSLDEYIDNLLDVASELRRVLRDDGNWWLNLGDSFAGSGGAGGQWGENPDGTATRDSDGGAAYNGPLNKSGFRRKSKMFVPHRVAIALQNQGWVSREDCIWVKPNPMPHPVKDRLHEHKEFVFHFTPEPDYWFNLHDVREPVQMTRSTQSNTGGRKTEETSHYPERQSRSRTHNFDRAAHPNGKNPGDVFEITVKAFPEAHFAVFPPELPEIPIKSPVHPKSALRVALPTTGRARSWNGKSGVARHPSPTTKLATETRPETTRAITVTALDSRSRLSVKSDRGNRPVTVRPMKQCQVSCWTRSRAPGPRAWSRRASVDASSASTSIRIDYVAMAQKRVGVTVDEPARLLDDEETTLTAYTDGGDGSLQPSSKSNGDDSHE